MDFSNMCNLAYYFSKYEMGPKTTRGLHTMKFQLSYLQLLLTVDKRLNII